MSAIFWDCNFDDMSQRYESMELPLEILLPLWYRPTSGSDQHQKLITSKKDHSLSMPAMCGRRPLPRVRQLQWRRNVSQWDGSSRPTFKSGTARNAFCRRPTFWPQTAYRACKLLKFVSMVSMFLTISGGKQNNCCNGA